MTSCTGDSNISMKFDLTKDDDLIAFYREVLERRNKVATEFAFRHFIFLLYFSQLYLYNYM